MPTVLFPLKVLTQRLASNVLSRLFPSDEYPETAKLLIKKAHYPIFVWDELTQKIGGLIPGGAVINTPLTGTAITGSDIFQEQLHEIEPAATIAALTVNLEATDNVAIGAVKRFAFTQVVTALTMAASAAGGGTIKGAAITAAAINTSIAYQKTASKTWRRLY